MLRRLALAAVLIFIASAPVNAATPTLYPLRAQDWWTPIAGLGGEGHIHFEYDFPIGQTVSGTITLPGQLVLHHNRGAGLDLRVHDDLGKECYRASKVTVATDAAGNGERSFPITLDTTCFTDGLRDIVFSWRIRQSDGNVMIVRAQWPTRIENGKADTNWKPNFFLGGGWYKQTNPSRDWGYIHSILWSAPPTAPVSGTWTVDVQYTRKPRASIVQNQEAFATVDPDFHEGERGTILETSVAMSPRHKLAIDTTRFSNGQHRLVLVTCSGIPAEGEEHCGVLVVPFTVQN